MISQNWLPAADKAFRSFLTFPEAEQAHVVALAAFLANHVPDKTENIWMALLGPEGTLQSEITGALIAYPTVWKLPDQFTQAYFFGTRHPGRSPLIAIMRKGHRLLMANDISTVYGSRYNRPMDCYGQLLSLHDGFFAVDHGAATKKRTVLDYHPPMADRLGFLAPGGEDFYRFVHSEVPFASRLIAYYYDPSSHESWTDVSADDLHLSAGLAAARRDGHVQIHSLIDAVRPELGHYHRVTMAKTLVQRIAAALRLAARISEGVHRETGARRLSKIVTLCRMFALLRGNLEVDGQDAELGIRVAYSQIVPPMRRLLAFAIDPKRRGKKWRIEQDVLPALGGARRTYEGLAKQLASLQILTRTEKGNQGARLRPQTWYAVTPECLELVRQIDPPGRVLADRAAQSIPIEPATEVRPVTVPDVIGQIPTEVFEYDFTV